MADKRVFISHVSSETELAQHLKQRLEADFLGLVDVFVSSDRETITAGSRWLDAVERALTEADVELVLCSPESVGRPWVNFEAGAAWIRSIPVIPVCHSGMSPELLPVPLSMLQGVELTSPALQKLYDAVASVLGATTPRVDFDALAADLHRSERAGLGRDIDRVEDPRILCGTNAQYAEPRYGFALDVEILLSTFGHERVTVEYDLTRRRLTELLTSQRFDIVHLVLPVDPDVGDLVFSRVDPDTYRAVTPGADRLPPAGLAALLRESQTRLVVLATCKALLLAVEVAHVANMAASDTVVSGQEAALWEDCFYTLVRQGISVFKAMELTRSQVDVPIRGVRHRDVAFAALGPTRAV